MADDDQTASPDPHDTWGRRRAHMRHSVSLPAVVMDRSVGPLACTVEDVSSTGMLLALELFMAEPGREPLKVGSRAELEFAPEVDDSPCANISVEVEVMWRSPIAVGVRYVNPDEELLGALRAVVALAVEDRAGGGSERREQAQAERRKVLLACRKTIERLLPNIIWTMRTEVTRRLRAMADGASANDAREVRAEADLIDEKANAIGRTIERQMLQGYAQASDLDQTLELTVRHLTPSAAAGKDDKPKLVAEQTSDRNARILAVGLAAEERYKKQFFSLNVRLANVIGHPVDAAHNPLVPANACRIMWEATVAHSDSPRVQRCLQQAMQQRVVPLLGELYDALDVTLDEHGARRIFDLR